MPSEYRLKRRVQFYETDMAGIVHFSWFFRYLEEAEHAMWREAGLSIAGGSGIGWPRVEASFEFHRPLEIRRRVRGAPAHRRQGRAHDPVRRRHLERATRRSRPGRLPSSASAGSRASRCGRSTFRRRSTRCFRWRRALTCRTPQLALQFFLQLAVILRRLQGRRQADAAHRPAEGDRRDDRRHSARAVAARPARAVRAGGAVSARRRSACCRPSARSAWCSTCSSSARICRRASSGRRSAAPC